MDCPNCHMPYDTSEHIPYLLFKCGHSICLSCLSQLFLNKSVKCPECPTITTGDSLASFPKNIALLSYTNLNQQENKGKYLCKTHGKNQEAFCEDDKQLLCIDCILHSSHKSHEIKSINESYKKAKENLFNNQQKSLSIENNLNKKLADLEAEKTELRSKLEEKSNIISEFFNEISKIIHERESLLKSNLNQLVEKEEYSIEKIKLEINNHLDLIERLKMECKIAEKESENDLLEKSKDRFLLCNEANKSPPNLSILSNLPDINKENEFNLIKQHFSKVSKPSTTLYSNTASFALKKANNPSNNQKIQFNNRPLFNNPLGIGPKPSKKNSHLLKQTTIGRSTAQANFPNKFQNQSPTNKQNNALPFMGSTTPSDLSIITSKYPIGDNSNDNSEILAQLKDCMVPGFKEEISIDSEEKKEKLNNLPLNLNSQGISQNLLMEEIKTNENNTKNETDKLKLVGELHSYQMQREKHKIEKTIQSKIDLKPKKIETGINIQNNATEDMMKKISNNIIESFNLSKVKKSKNKNDLKNYQINKSHDSQISSEINEKFQNQEEDKEEEKKIEDVKTPEKLNLNFLENSKLTESERSDFKSFLDETFVYIFAFSGINSNGLLSCERYELHQGTWHNIAMVTIPRAKFSTIISQEDQNIYLLGGMQIGGSRTDLVEKYNPFQNTMEISSLKLYKPLSSFSSLSVKNGFYICGGSDGTILNTMQFYDFSKKEWIEKPGMKSKREDFGFVLAADNKIYSIGGFNGQKCLKECERFDPSKGTWEEIASLNYPRRSLGCVALADGIYAIGGILNDKNCNYVEKYDESKNEWKQINPLKHKRSNLTAVNSQDSQFIYVIGGYDGEALNLVERYDVLKELWELVSPLNTKRSCHSSVILNTKEILSKIN